MMTPVMIVLLVLEAIAGLFLFNAYRLHKNKTFLILFFVVLAAVVVTLLLPKIAPQLI